MEYNRYDFLNETISSMDYEKFNVLCWISSLCSKFVWIEEWVKVNMMILVPEAGIKGMDK